MSNRFEDEFPSLDWQIVPPPLGPDGAQAYSRRARRARNEVVHQALRVGAASIGRGARALAARIVPIARRLGELLTCAGYGAAKRWPDAGDCR